MSIHQLAQQGKHNLFNSMAAGVAARVLDIRKEIIRESLSDFQNVEHRLEEVTKIHGINFINDSKATNVNSTWYALESMQQPTIWIVGGVDKGNDYSILEGLVKQKFLELYALEKIILKLKKHLVPLLNHFLRLVLLIRQFKLVTESLKKATMFYFLQLVQVLICLKVMKIEDINLKVPLDLFKFYYENSTKNFC